MAASAVNWVSRPFLVPDQFRRWIRLVHTLIPRLSLTLALFFLSKAHFKESTGLCVGKIQNWRSPSF